MVVIKAKRALLPDGWREDVTVEIDTDGRIARVVIPTAPVPGAGAGPGSGSGGAGQGTAAEENLPSGAEGSWTDVDVLLPAPANLHSHAFQRAMAGRTERRSGERDSFWTWRELMYRFLDRLTPDHVKDIAAQVQVEMLEAGYAAVGEFHYLHHQPDGTPYAKLGTMSESIVEAAKETEIGLTLLPVLYERGGLDGRPLSGGQLRFGNDAERFGSLLQEARQAVAALPGDARVGVAPHSLRAVSADTLGGALLAASDPDAPVHIHAAEQVAEVEAVKTSAEYGLRPVEWLLEHLNLGSRLCVIHATHMTPEETHELAKSGAVAGLCPITEANLGDGIFDGARFLKAGGRFGVGSDSNVLIGLAPELRQLEYSQRLRDRSRAVLAEADRSTGRVLYEGACRGGAQALGRHAAQAEDSGRIAQGAWADLVGLDGAALALAGLEGDELLDGWIFAGGDDLVSEVWAAGRHVVSGGRHRARDPVERRFRAVLRELAG